MARIAGIDLPKEKRGEIGLTYIFGIGKRTATNILKEAKIDLNIKVKDWNDDQQAAIRKIITDNARTRKGRKKTIANKKKIMKG